ncbi:MarR family winged helix-turn-helix transcriptional regulator, partial [Croceicoccus mobilis]
MSGDSGEINLPFDLSIGYQIRLTHRLMQKLLQLKIEQFGVTLGMWYFLRVLWDQDGLTQKELSDLVGTMEPTTLSAIASMEQRGIVARVRNAADKRKINIFLTPYGH